jgi:DNA-binding NtrC family response regulator
MPPLYGDTASLLIVDDDPSVAHLLETVLQREGYRCTLAGDASEARARLAEREFAVALCDVMLPGESGLELAADMLREYPDLAVVMVTGVDDPHIADLALESGAYGYLVKPFQLNQVLITVATASRLRCLEIERRRYEQRLEQRVPPDN